MKVQQSIDSIKAELPSKLDKAAGLAEAYKMGHRDALHAASEKAREADAVIAEARKIIVELCQCYGNPLPEATLAKM